ncbi:TonB-dependent receptor [Tenacibaculum caenipelagi]|uniref:Iron complex outermembrane receptor protein n=1 Tax=Tenacibaculum caenipelagi TaxID=1325435 RepID=A0A4R6TGL3_9FLAO|nr:TonB-dependent receptor [Tenacibaculum caenipelagi]TDQ25798.1 iron complex outermembrane receptor protein [Tenacibaculum caenipelagi]
MLKNIVLVVAMMLFAIQAKAQNLVEFKILSDEKEPIVGASVYLKNTTLGTETDFNGLARINSVPNGKQTFVVSFIGFETIEKTIVFPTTKKQFTLELHESEETLDAVVIQSARSKRTIAEIPTRIEVIGAEELGEKAVMNSANIAMLLRESTGIQMQQTSANSANQSIRIQGLDGRFTQLLKDGFPLFGGFSSGLSIMQIPPLDLQQVEIIKGSSSTLYGGGAIAGLVNLVTKQPKDEREVSLMFDQTSRNGSTINAFYSERYNKVGVTLYGSANRQEAADVNNDHFSDIPQVRSFSINPSLFYYPNEREQWRLNFNTTLEDRIGGDIDVIEDNMTSDHNFYEKNKTERYAVQLSYTNNISEDKSFNFKNSVSYFKRNLSLPDYTFDGKQWATFTEATYNLYKDTSDWVFGGNIITEKFIENPATTINRSYNQFTFGGFAQNNWKLASNLTLESGLRTDYNDHYGTFLLPRVSLFIKYNEAVSSRIGGGLGYKIPTIFTEDAELISYQNVQPIDLNNFKAETSIGFNADVNYKTRIFNDNVSLSFNQLIFYTQLKNSLLLEANGANYEFINSTNPLNSYGAETNLKLKYKDFILFTNYAYNNVKIEGNQKALTPKHSIGGVLMYEVHDKWRVGYEAYYKSSQLRNDLTTTPNFWTMGFMVMRTFGKISIYTNFENFTDTKQQNYQSMIQAPHNNPSFTDIWAPTDGFVFNAGILVKL